MRALQAGRGVRQRREDWGGGWGHGGTANAMRCMRSGALTASTSSCMPHSCAIPAQRLPMGGGYVPAVHALAGPLGNVDDGIGARMIHKSHTPPPCAFLQPVAAVSAVSGNPAQGLAFVPPRTAQPAPALRDRPQIRAQTQQRCCPCFFSRGQCPVIGGNVHPTPVTQPCFQDSLLLFAKVSSP